MSIRLFTSGFYGPRCDLPCRVSGCKGGRCDKNSGYCPCQLGYFGEACNQPCPLFTYGKNCFHTCQCSREGTERCDPRVSLTGNRTGEAQTNLRMDPVS